MRRLFLLLVFSLVPCLIACGSRQWVQVNGNEDFDSASSFCDAVARGNAPLPAPQSPLNYSVYGSGMVGTTPYTYSGTFNENPLSHGINQMNATLGALAAQNQIFELCMNRMGWALQDESTANNQKYTACVKKYADWWAYQFDNLQHFVSRLEEVCKKETGGYVANMASYYAAQALKEKEEE